MLISIVIPVLNEAKGIPTLWSRVIGVLQQIPNCQFEVVFVDDGSTDATVDVIQALTPLPSIGWRLIKLSRNFGHQAAITAGMEQAAGEALIFLDADLQDPPELIPEFLQKFREGYDVVYGIRQNRKEALWLRFCFGAFYRIFNAIAEHPIPLSAGDFGLISRRVAQLIADMPERDRLVRGLRSWVGFRQTGIPYDRPERFEGKTRYRLAPRIEGALDGLFGFSKLPIRFAFLCGIGVFVIGGAYLVWSYITMLITGDSGVLGWRSVVTLAFMMGGANLIATATVGEYVSRIYFQGKQRPLYVIARTTSSSEDPIKQPADSAH